jgi:surface antigen
MKAVVTQLMLLLLSITLAACSSLSFHQGQGAKSEHAMQGSVANSTSAQAGSGEAVGGGIGRSMDANDQSKLSHALDKPLGKSTQWVNANSNTTYTVVPTQKVEINGNPYCRRYTITAIRDGNTHEINGTACVAANSNWEAVSG